MPPFTISTLDEAIPDQVQSAMDLALNGSHEAPENPAEHEFLTAKLPPCLIAARKDDRFAGFKFARDRSHDLYDAVVIHRAMPKFLTDSEQTEFGRFFYEQSAMIGRYIEWVNLMSTHKGSSPIHKLEQ